MDFQIFKYAYFSNNTIKLACFAFSLQNVHNFFDKYGFKIIARNKSFSIYLLYSCHILFTWKNITVYIKNLFTDRLSHLSVIKFRYFFKSLCCRFDDIWVLGFLYDLIWHDELQSYGYRDIDRIIFMFAVHYGIYWFDRGCGFQWDITYKSSILRKLCINIYLPI